MLTLCLQGIHPAQTGSLLSGAHISKGAIIHSGISIDQRIAARVGEDTPQSSIVLSPHLLSPHLRLISPRGICERTHQRKFRTAAAAQALSLVLYAERPVG